MLKWFKKWQARRIEDPVQREKMFADINGEPWVKVLDVEFGDINHPSVGAFEMDWNDHFVEWLKENGYSGRTPEQVVDMWFRDVCRSIVEENNQ